MLPEHQHPEKNQVDLFHVTDGKKFHAVHKQRKEEGINHEPQKPGRLMLVLGVMLVLTVLVQAFNFTQQAQISSQLGNQTTVISSIGVQGSSATTANYAAVPSNLPDVIPKGIPRIYGAALGISFDDVSPNDQQKANQTIAVLSQFDQEESGKFITLAGEEEQRYIKIASQIACEYCCGAESLIFSDGKRACGCAHSYSMRGLAKYLLQNNPNDFTDDQILEELGKWKTLFFPGILSQKAQVLKDKGIELNYINLASNKYRGIEKGAPQNNGPMVGGC